MDEQLRQLIEEVCQHPLKSLKRRKAMNRLLFQIQQLPRLWKSSHPDYLEALNQTFEWVNRRICQDFSLDNPLIQKRLVQWINSYLRWRIKDLYSPDKRASLSLDATIGGEETETTFLEQLSETGFNAPTRSGFDAYIEQIEREQQQSISLVLEEYIEENPEGRLGNCHPKARPDCNCQLLTQRLLLKSPPDKLAGIAKELGIKYQTLNSHWKRNCLPLLQEVAKELGYQPEP
ncbi:MAG TPA: hypothetical protein DDZ80_29805 [Cyanobacteria bacterium UBA8803]|nr:hypothetical protein [Cyanobacteria bacterium UBA9273]HBL62435.1 hypothetical protein [Cyanobacteria bacterium UBA8803]